MKQSLVLALSILFFGCHVSCLSVAEMDADGVVASECAIDELVAQPSELLPAREHDQMAWRCWVLLAKLALIERALRDAAGGGGVHVQDALRQHKISRGEAVRAAITRALCSIDPLLQNTVSSLDQPGAKRAGIDCTLQSLQIPPTFWASCPSLQSCTLPSFSVYDLLNNLRSAYTRLLQIQIDIDVREKGWPPDWTPISALEIPYTITEPGVYRLICEVDSSYDSPLITVSAQGALLDLSGHTLEDIGVLHNQVGVDICASNFTLQNGRIRNCLVGVQVDQTSTDIHSVLLRDLQISGCRTGVLFKGVSQGYIADVLCASNNEGILLTTDVEPSAQDLQDVVVANTQLSGATSGHGIAVELLESTVEAGPIVLVKNVATGNNDSGFYVSQTDSTHDVLLKSNIAMNHGSSDGFEVVCESAGAALVNNYSSQNNVNYDLVGVVNAAEQGTVNDWAYWENMSLF